MALSDKGMRRRFASAPSGLLQGEGATGEGGNASTSRRRPRCGELGGMFGAVIHAPGDVRYEERDDPTIIEPTDAVVRTVAACVCGSDLWRYRGISSVNKPVPIGHEYCGVVEVVGDAVTSVKVGDFVVGGFPSRQHLPGVSQGRSRQLPARGVLRRLPGGPDPRSRRPTARSLATPETARRRPDPQHPRAVRRDVHRLARGGQRRCRARARVSSWSVTARLVCALSWPPSSSVRRR